jgi:hypothetical protein
MDDNTNQPKRRRGRPRKNQQHSAKESRKISHKDLMECKVKDKQKKHNTDPIILNLPIRMNDINSIIKFNKKDMTKKVDNRTSETSDIFTINDISYESSSEEKYKTTDQEIRKLLIEKDNMIEKLQKELNEYKDLISENIISGAHSKVNYMDINLVNYKNGKTIIIDKTNISCWWCTEKFNTLPCFIIN